MPTSVEWRGARHQVLKSLYLFLESRHKLPVDPRWGVINPMRMVRKPKVDKDKPPASLDPDEIEKVFAAAKRPQEKIVLRVLGETGMRAGELVSITRERVGPDYVTVSGKTGTNDIPLSPETCEILRQLVPSGPVFISYKTHNPLTISGVYQMVRDLFERAGIKNKRHMGPHALRHSFARRWLALGGYLESLRTMLGHADISTTQRYAHLEKQEVAAKQMQFSLFHNLEKNNGDNGHKDDKDLPDVLKNYGVEAGK